MMAEKRKLSFLLLLSLRVGFIQAIHSRSVYANTHSYNVLGIIGMMLSERVTARARREAEGVYLEVHNDGGVQWGNIQVQVVPSNSDGQADTAEGRLPF